MQWSSWQYKAPTFLPGNAWVEMERREREMMVGSGGQTSSDRARSSSLMNLHLAMVGLDIRLHPGCKRICAQPLGIGAGPRSL